MLLGGIGKRLNVVNASRLVCEMPLRALIIPANVAAKGANVAAEGAQSTGE
jgi:hypothetical protein